MEKKKRLVPYSMVLPGFEAVYTGEKVTKSSEISEKKIESCHYADESGNVIEKWSVWTWTKPGEEKDWGAEIEYINKMQEKLGSLNDKIRQIRAHIGSLVPCDSGFPVTVDELLNAIGKGELSVPSFHNGCWQCGKWWDTKGAQPFQIESMRTINAVLRGYLAGTSKEELIAKFPYAKGFINRTYEWLGPVSKLSRIQKLMMEWILLPFEFWTNYSMTAPSTQARQLCDSLVKDIFGIEFDPDKGSWIACEGGRGPKLNNEINREENNRDLKELWSRIKSAKNTLADCHHNTFRYIENWIHSVGTKKWGIPTRKQGAEKERLGRLLFGYVFGLDKWLLGIPMQFVLLDLGHIDLGFDPKNEILRVYAYLGEKTPVKEWLAACLWYNLMYNDLYNKPSTWNAGLIRHKKLLKTADQAGINVHEWMDSVLRNASRNSNGR